MEARRLVWLGLALAGCGGDAETRARRTRELAACIDAIDRAPQLAPDGRLVAIARGCAPACAGLAPWADAVDAPAAARSWRSDWKAGTGAATPGPATADDALMTGCAPACPSPRAAPRTLDPWADLVAQCGPAALGLGKERAYLASSAWWILSRVAAWTDARRKEPLDDGQLGTQLERATLRASFPLPLPGRLDAGGYTLATSRRGRASDARLYVIVNAAQVRIGAVPLARLRGGELTVAAAAGGDFPGPLIDDAQLGQVFTEDASLAGGDAAPPLLLVDEMTPAARLAAVLAALGVARAELAVAQGGARAHPVLLERAGPDNAAAPVITVSDASGAGVVRIAGFGDARATTWAGLAEELDNFAAVNAPVRTVTLAAGAPITTAQLVQILDACANARVAALVLADTAR